MRMVTKSTLPAAGFAPAQPPPRRTPGAEPAADSARASAATIAAAAELAELDALDRDVVTGPVARVARHVRDRVDDLHAARDATEDGVLAVQPGAGVRG